MSPFQPRLGRGEGAVSSAVVLRRFACPVLLLTLWLAVHPYIGIAGDARFYNVQFLRALHPPAFASDLYFRYGSQDDYSAFTAAFTPVIAALGLNTGNIVLNIAFQCLWLGGLWCFLSAFVPQGIATLIGFAAAVVLPGGVSFVHYGEPLLTPRLLAEGLSLWGLGAMLRGYRLRALLWLVVAFCFHPLMTLPALALLFLDLARGNRFWWLVPMVGAIALTGLLAMGIPPFTRLLERYDPAWFEVVNVRDGFCLISNWSVVEWLPVCNTLALTGAGLVLGAPEQRRLLQSALLVGLAGLAASFVGGDMLRLSIVTDAQLWRGFWLLSLVANICFGLALARLWASRSRPLGLPLALLLLAALLLALSRTLVTFVVIPAPLVAIGAGCAIWANRRPRSLPALVRVALAVCFVLTFAVTGLALAPSLHVLAVSPLGLWPALLRILLIVVCLLGICWAHRAPQAVPAPALFLLVLAMLVWDQRTPWAVFTETTPIPPASLAALLPASAQIYWEGDVTVPWFVLQRASYFSCEQGTGVLFNRGTALAYQARYDSFRPLGTIDFSRDPYCRGGNDRTLHPLRGTDLASVCRREPALDDLVLTEPIVGDEGVRWVPPAEFRTSVSRGGQKQRATASVFHIYSCANYRAGGT